MDTQDAALAAIDPLLGDGPLAPDLLIEYLHRLQDRFGGLTRAHLAALAERLRLPQAEVYAVASFYHNFDLIGDAAAAQQRRRVRVCTSLTCALRGSADLLAQPGAEPTSCIGACDRAPATWITEPGMSADADSPIDPAEISEFERLRRGELSATTILDLLEQADLRGMGGAGFPAARKWRLVAGQPGPRVLVVNADEGEPGTFKDRHLLTRHLGRVLDGALIAARCVGADTLYVYLRDEYAELRAPLAAAIATLERLGLAAPGSIHLRRGAGAYICGEESALLESLEGKRGLPRHKPPYPAQQGLFGRPTLIHNVETLYWVAEILRQGVDWWRSHGRRGEVGLRWYSLSGAVARPGVYCAPNGIAARELIDEYGGGMAPGHRLAAYLPGGASGGILPAHLADLPLAFGRLEAQGCFVGSGAVIALSDRDDLRLVVRNLVAFFRHESCGQCTPCRVGTVKAAAALDGADWDWTDLDWAQLDDLAAVMRDGSICGLGQAVPNSWQSIQRHFLGPDAGRGDSR